MHYCVNKSPPPKPAISQLNSGHTFKTFFSKIPVNNTIQSMSRFYAHNLCGCVYCTSPCTICVLYNSSFFIQYSWRRLRWSRGSMLVFGTQICGFKPGQSRQIFKGEKILSTPSFGGEVKPSVPCRRFAACKRSLELRRNRILDKICWNISHPRRVPPSAARGLSQHEGT